MYSKSNPFILTEEDHVAIEGAVAEVDPRQAEIDRDLTIAQRAQIFFAMCNLAVSVGRWLVQHENPELSEAEAQRIYLQRYYAAKALPGR